jgi:hypothetical protein
MFLENRLLTSFISCEALFLVQSPLHIQNAREAILKFGITHSTFFIVTKSDRQKWAKMMISALPTDSHCLFCERDDQDIVSAIKEYTKHLAWLKSQSFDYVFFADTRLYIFVDIVNALQHSNTLLTDDGAGIIQSVHTLKTKHKYFDIPISTAPDRRKLIEQTKKKYGLWQLNQVKYDLFTAFDFEPCDQFNVHVNPMLGLSYNHTNVDDNEVLIVGQPFVKNGHMKPENYLACVEKIQHKYHGKNITYLPHPRETDVDKLTLQKITGMNIIDTNLTVEMYLMHQSKAPGTVAGFYSAALWYVAKFQPNIRVEAFRLSPDLYCFPVHQMMWGSSDLTKLEVTDLVYDYFKLRIKVTDIFVTKLC